MFDSVPSESSSSEKLAGESPPPVVNEKSWASLGWASFTTMMRPRLLFVNVHVTFSPGLKLMFDTGLPSLQVADA